MAKSNYAENRTLEYLLRSGNVYLALFTTLPDEDNAGGVEVSTAGTAYARKQVTFNPASGGQCVNSADLVFNQATANWGEIVGFGVYDAAAAGNQVYADLLPGGSISINFTNGRGDQLLIPAGTLIISED